MTAPTAAVTAILVAVATRGKVVAATDQGGAETVATVEAVEMVATVEAVEMVEMVEMVEAGEINVRHASRRREPDVAAPRLR